MHSSESCQSYFGNAPEVFNAVDMALATTEFILAMMDTMMLAVANINQAIICFPAITVDNAVRIYFSLNDAV